MRIPVILIVMFGLLLGLTGCTTEKSIEKEVRRKKPIAELTAKELYEAYSTNAKASDRLYKGKIVVVSGNIKNVNKEFNGGSSVMMDANSNGSGVVCYFAPEHEKKLKEISLREEVTIRGKCEGCDVSVTLRGCILE